MSKAVLKKELSSFTKEQLLDVILDMYSARKEFKEYLEFFVNPDSKALFEKYSQQIGNETYRISRGRSKMRVNVVKRCIKDFLSFNPDLEYCIEIYIVTLAKITFIPRRIYFGLSCYNLCEYLVNSVLNLAETNEMLDTVVLRIETIARDANNDLRMTIQSALNQFIEDKAI